MDTPSSQALKIEQMRLFYELFPYPNRPFFLFPKEERHLTVHGGFSGLLALRQTSLANKIYSISKSPQNIEDKKSINIDEIKKILSGYFDVSKRILLVGSGTDEPLLFRILHPIHEIIAIEISKKNITIAKRKLALLSLLGKLKRKYFAHVEFVNGHALSVLEGKFSGKFDHIQCFGFLHHQPNAHEYFKAFADNLNVDGTVRIMVYSYHGRRLERKIQKRFLHLWEYQKKKGKNKIRSFHFKLRLWQIFNFLNLNKTTSKRFKYLGLNSASVADALLHPSDYGFPLENILPLAEKSSLELVYCEALLTNHGRVCGFYNPIKTWDLIVKADKKQDLLSNPILIFKKGHN